MRKEADASGADATPRLNAESLTRFPVRDTPEGDLGRPVYFEWLHPVDRALLITRGYRPYALMELPRGTPAAEEAYLLAKAQALEEGTAPSSKLQVLAVELQMKANKMLEKGSNVRVNVNVGKKDVAALLAGWGSSRHTLRGNTTIHDAQVSVKEPAARIKKKGRKK